ncbi:MAG: hypothetical protein A2096_00920 [Spirochaetes bacterium GWF1_41_5]|nr:MAG: hypothetical protein A2096_00920 [Spirochaetes bacterium GWF1_41_5]
MSFSPVLSIIDSLADYVTVKIKACTFSSHPADYHETKAHDDFDLWIITEGNIFMEFTDNPGADKILRALPGDIIFFKPGLAYHCRSNNTAWSVLFIHFDFSLAKNRQVLHEFSFLRHIPALLVSPEAGHFIEACRRRDNKMPMSGLALHGSFLSLLSKILFLNGTQNINAVSASYSAEQNLKNRRKTQCEPVQRLLPAIQFIKEHPDKHHTNQALASLCGMSVGHFITSFGSVMGMPPKQYISATVFTRARSMLYEKKSVKETASLSGFSDQFVFSKAFKKYFGMAPSKISY